MTERTKKIINNQIRNLVIANKMIYYLGYKYLKKSFIKQKWLVMKCMNITKNFNGHLWL